MSYRQIMMFMVTLMVASCGTTKLSTKEVTEVQSGKKAILTTYNQPLLASIILSEQPLTLIISIDGKKLDSKILKNDERVAIEVGKHKIKFNCVSRSGQDERDFSEVLELNMKPHYEYRVRCSFDSRFASNGAYTGSFSIKEKRIK